MIHTMIFFVGFISFEIAFVGRDNYVRELLISSLKCNVVGGMKRL